MWKLVKSIILVIAVIMWGVIAMDSGINERAISMVGGGVLLFQLVPLWKGTKPTNARKHQDHKETEGTEEK